MTWVALLPLLGFFLGLLAYWFWTRAKEARTDADLQRRMWEHSKYQRDDFAEQTPLQTAEQFSAEYQRFRGLALTLGVLAVICLVGGVFAFARTHQ